MASKKITITCDWYFDDGVYAPDSAVLRAIENELRSYMDDSSFRRGIDDQLKDYANFHFSKIDISSKTTKHKLLS